MMSKKKLFAIALMLTCMIPFSTNAEENYIVNQNNVVISRSEYDNLSKVHTDAFIMTMTQDNFDELKNIDYSNAITETKYIESSYNPSLNILSEREITEEEYNNTDNMITPYGSYVETTYKMLSLSVTDTGTAASHTLSNIWKITPSARSFDVIALRLQNYTIVSGSQSGYQIYSYTNDSSYKSIYYAANGTNIKRFSNGYGISMNLKDGDNIDYLELTTSSTSTPGSGGRAVYGTYQHATADLTLAQSQNYTLGASGLGGVLVFPYSISQHYDGMTGVQVLK